MTIANKKSCRPVENIIFCGAKNAAIEKDDGARA